jgi:hypothetical protein
MTTFQMDSGRANVFLSTNDINDPEIKYLEKICLINDILFDKNEKGLSIDNSKIETLLSILKDNKEYESILKMKSL